MSELLIGLAIAFVIVLVLVILSYPKSDYTVCRLSRPVPSYANVQQRTMSPCQIAALRRAALEQMVPDRVHGPEDTGVWDNENTLVNQGYRPEPGMGSVTEGLWGSGVSHGDGKWDSITPISRSEITRKMMSIDTSGASASRFSTMTN